MYIQDEELKTQIIKDLPNFPVDVVEQFLLPYAEDFGWPPGKREDDLNNNWKYILRKNDLIYWREVKWNKKTLKLSPHNLLPKDIEIVVNLMQANVQGKTTLFSLAMPKSKERFDRICSYLKREGMFPKTVAIEQIGDRFRIVDGSHRLSAYFYLRGWFKIKDEKVLCLNVKEEQDYWVAEKIEK